MDTNIDMTNIGPLFRTGAVFAATRDNNKQIGEKIKQPALERTMLDRLPLTLELRQLLRHLLSA
jgi:hypothetical protein